MSESRVAVSSNGLGTAGFVTSIIGLLTCGFLSPLGLLFSVIALFKWPRGMAIAGTVLGAIGSLWLFTVGFAMVMSVLGIGYAAKEAATTIPLVTATVTIQRAYENDGKLPDSDSGNKLIADGKDIEGHALRYEPTGAETFDIRSAGPDGQLNTQDDRVLHSKAKPGER